MSKINFNLSKVSKSDDAAANKLGINLESISADVYNKKSVDDIVSENVLSSLSVALSSCMVTDQVINEELSRITE